jgi:hypothetical protein
MTWFKLLIKKYISQMNKWLEYLKTPGTIITLIVFVFWLWWIRASLNFRINKLEEFQHSVDMVEIQSTLTAMQKDIERIRIQLQK